MGEGIQSRDQLRVLRSQSSSKKSRVSKKTADVVDDKRSRLCCANFYGGKASFSVLGLARLDTSLTA